MRELVTLIDLQTVDAAHARAFRCSLSRQAKGSTFSSRTSRGNAFTLSKLDERVRLRPITWRGAEVAAATETMQ
ncbi:MAG: hypothetical protein R3C16_08895 [Hyphomonadaceae bacterium]